MCDPPIPSLDQDLEHLDNPPILTNVGNNYVPKRGRKKRTAAENTGEVNDSIETSSKISVSNVRKNVKSQTNRGGQRNQQITESILHLGGNQQFELPSDRYHGNDAIHTQRNQQQQFNENSTDGHALEPAMFAKLNTVESVEEAMSSTQARGSYTTTGRNVWNQPQQANLHGNISASNTLPHHNIPPPSSNNETTTTGAGNQPSMVPNSYSAYMDLMNHPSSGGNTGGGNPSYLEATLQSYMVHTLNSMVQQQQQENSSHGELASVPTSRGGRMGEVPAFHSMMHPNMVAGTQQGMMGDSRSGIGGHLQVAGNNNRPLNMHMENSSNRQRSNMPDVVPTESSNM